MVTLAVISLIRLWRPSQSVQTYQEIILHYLRLAWNYASLEGRNNISTSASTQIHNRENLHGNTGVTPHGIYTTPNHNDTPQLPLCTINRKTIQSDQYIKVAYIKICDSASDIRKMGISFRDGT
ncbi:unnamed protein product [Brugia pahangi]|uniref:Uncharacterized protein n=1 Tax=Brugia pahangi TaxID=6280 RepID=A0A0N4TXY8_BRUPA|nr:unnamed protein product [Brugia pahangi]